MQHPSPGKGEGGARTGEGLRLSLTSAGPLRSLRVGLGGEPMHKSPILLAILPAFALAACGQSGGSKAANAATAANGSTQTNTANTAAPAAAPAANGSNASAAAAGPARPVMMGGDPELDLCSSTAQVKAGRTAVVRDAPNAGAREIERLPAGTVLRICDFELMTGAPSDWAGVAYRRGGAEAPGCDLGGRAPADKVPVPAACPSGWVQFNEDVEQIGG